MPLHRGQKTHLFAGTEVKNNKLPIQGLVVLGTESALLADLLFDGNDEGLAYFREPFDAQFMAAAAEKKASSSQHLLIFGTVNSCRNESPIGI